MIHHVGTLLKNARLDKGLTLQDVSKATHIRLPSLEAIEENAWDKLSSRTYAQGIIKQYGKFMELEEEKLIAYFRREYSLHENMRFKKKAPHTSFVSHKRLALVTTAVLLFLMIASFFGYQTYMYLKPPEITIISPTETSFKRVEKVLLVGTAPKEALIKVNGKTLYLDEKNRFETYIPLPRATNTVTIEAMGANGRKSTLIRTLKRLDL